jgi:autophagy-related protein 9
MWCRQLWDIRQFCQERMGLSDSALANLPWPELLQRLVAVQRSVRLSLRGDLSQHDIVMRIMRKDDYLMGVQPSPRCAAAPAATLHAA